MDVHSGHVGVLDGERILKTKSLEAGLGKKPDSLCVQQVLPTFGAEPVKAHRFHK